PALDAQAAHQPAAGARDLRGVQRKSLVLRDAEVHGPQFRQPRRRAILPAAAADAPQSLRLVANADLFELDARAEQRRQVANQIAEADGLFAVEVHLETRS